MADLSKIVDNYCVRCGETMPTNNGTADKMCSTCIQTQFQTPKEDDITEEELLLFQRHFQAKSNSSRPFLTEQENEAIKSSMSCLEHRKKHKVCPPSCPNRREIKRERSPNRNKQKRSFNDIYSDEPSEKKQKVNSEERHYERIDLKDLEDAFEDDEKPVTEFDYFSFEKRERPVRANGQIAKLALSKSSSPNCPGCGQLILLNPGEDFETKLDQHLDLGCPTEPTIVPKESDPMRSDSPVQSVPPTPPKSRLSEEGPACVVCSRHYKDLRKATQPEHMQEFYRSRGWEGTLQRDDILCKPCYTAFFDKKRKERNIEAKKREMEEESENSAKNSPKLQKEEVIEEIGDNEVSIDALSESPEVVIVASKEKLNGTGKAIRNGHPPVEPRTPKFRKAKKKDQPQPETPKESTPTEFAEATTNSEETVGLISGKQKGGTKILKCNWIGKPIKKNAEKAYYYGVLLDNTEYYTGTAARFKAAGKNSRPFLGRIGALYEEDGNMMVECIWYFFPDDIPGGKQKPKDKYEVFLSDLRDVNSVGTLVSSAEVLWESEFRLREKKGQPLQNIFYCTTFYNPHLNTFRALLCGPEDNIYHTSFPDSESDEEDLEQQLIIEKSKNQLLMAELCLTQSLSGPLSEKKMKPPKNWPYNVQYTPTLLWDDKIPHKVKDFLNQDFCDDVEVLPIPKDSDHPARGQFGLFAKRDLADGKIIGEYTGKVMLSDRDESDKRYLSILYEDDNIAVDIDAGKCGNETRFINDYRGSAKAANVKYQRMKFGGCWHILIITKKKIKKGKELLGDYGGNTYWNNLKKTNE